MILLLGFIAQGLFGLRLIVQLWHTERYKSTKAPSLYWFISLWAALLYLCYGVLRHDIVVVLGQLITYFIYIRNVQLQGKWSHYPLFWKMFYFLVPFGMTLGYMFTPNQIAFSGLDTPMFLIGFLGQLLMNARFIIQWIYAERVSSAAFPLFFWYLSIAGSLMLLAYGCWHPQHGFDPVIILSQVLAVMVYTRSALVQQKMTMGKPLEK